MFRARAIGVKLAPPRDRRLGKDGRMLETPILHEIRAALLKVPGVQVWRNNTGKLKDHTGRLVTYGLAPGSSDLIGIVHLRTPVLGAGGKVLGHVDDAWSRCGRFFAFEVKRPGEKPNAAQLQFLDLVRSFGGAAGWGSSVEDAVGFVERVKEWRE